MERRGSWKPQSLVNSPEFERLGENAKYETLKHQEPNLLLETLKVKNPKRSKHQRQDGVIENRTLFN